MNPKLLNLKRFMLRRGVKQADVAVRMGVSSGCLSDLLSGRKPVANYVIREIRKLVKELATSAKVAPPTTPARGKRQCVRMRI
jgi:transcriptional regulator with XRE-family HTH domain